MPLKPIRNDDDYAMALAEIDEGDYGCARGIARK